MQTWCGQWSHWPTAAKAIDWQALANKKENWRTANSEWLNPHKCETLHDDDVRQISAAIHVPTSFSSARSADGPMRPHPSNLEMQSGCLAYAHAREDVAATRGA
jgi:hypothetical protein